MTDPTSLPNFPPPPDEHPLRGRVLDALQDVGYTPDIDKDGDVSFKVQGQQLFVRIMEGDLDILRIFGQWQIGPDVPQDLHTQLNACNDLTLGLNIVKAGIASGTLVMTGEHIIAKEEDVRGKLKVTVQLLLSAVQMWHKNIMSTEETKHTAEGSHSGRVVRPDDPPVSGGRGEQGGRQGETDGPGSGDGEAPRS